MKKDELNRRQFIKGTSLTTLALATPHSIAKISTPSLEKDNESVEAKFETVKRKKWKNWTGNVGSSPIRILKPKNLSELKNLVKTYDSIKAVGEGHSFSACALTNQTLVSLERLNNILSYDKENLTVTVEAGMKLSDFNRRLEKIDLALPSLGDVEVQALAGLVSTATHGNGMKWGSLSDRKSLIGMTLVLADGDILELHEDRSEDRELLKAARVSLGALGIIYSLTFRVAPLHNLELTAEILSIDEALKESHYNKNDHYEFFYFPFTDKAYALTRNVTKKKRLNRRIRSWFNEVFMENIVLNAILECAATSPKNVPKTMDDLTKLASTDHNVDTSFRIMTSKRLFRIYDIEYALPIHKAQAGIEAYRSVVKDFSEKNKNSYYAHLPVEVRYIRGDQGTFLSHAQGRDTCYLDITSHLAFDGHREFFKELEIQFLKFGGRPHWGKQFYKNPSKLYPNFDRFNELRKQLDPKGKFINEYVLRLITGHNF